jgi:hypothetical protein
MDNYDNQAEQNRQLLQRYTPEQCILLELPDHIFVALQAGAPITWQHYLQGTRKLGLKDLRGLVLFLVLCLAVVAPVSLLFSATSPLGAATLPFATSAILLFFGAPVLYIYSISVIPFIDKLSLLWKSGKLLVSQQVEIVAPQDSDETYGLRYTFETPSGSITDQVDSSKTIDDQVKAQPIMLMLYRSPKDYLIL